jgi:hypothetical protein
MNDAPADPNYTRRHPPESCATAAGQAQTKAQIGTNAPTLAAVRPSAWQAPPKGLRYEQCET